MAVDRAGQGAALAEICYQSIKSAIVEDELKPGTVLQERALAEKLSVSRTPVREALQRLAKDGLVEIIPGKGAIVSKFTAEDVREILQIRELLEGLAARLTADNATTEDLEWMESLLSPTNQYLAEKRFKDLYEVDLKFHSFLAGKSQNSRLISILNMLGDQIRRMTSLSREDPIRASESIAQHKAILEAIKARDAETAEEAMRHHIRSVRAYLFARMGFR